MLGPTLAFAGRPNPPPPAIPPSAKARSPGMPHVHVSSGGQARSGDRVKVLSLVPVCRSLSGDGDIRGWGLSGASKQEALPEGHLLDFSGRAS